MTAERGLSVEVRLVPRRAGGRQVDVRFEVAPGVTILFGPSGAGKSTTLAAIAGLVAPTAGRIVLGGRVLFDSEARWDEPPERRRVALVFQSLALFPHLSVEENVAYGLPAGLGRAEQRRRALAWLERMRVAHTVGRRPDTLSGGEAQRVALARALASEPRALLLDEPFSAMDGRLRAQLGEEVRGLVAELAIPTVLVTHDREDALRLGERAVGLEQGRVTGMGTPSEVVGVSR